MMTFDTEKFIKEIENRKAIWDPSIDEYADRDCRRRLWDEITSSMFNNEISEDERRDISKLLQQKWKNIRTSFTRELRRRTGKSGLAVSRKSPYIYFDNLKFLRTAVESTQAHENDDTDQDESYAEENIVCCQSSPHRQKIRKIEKRHDDLEQILNRCTAMTGRPNRKRRLDLEPDTDKLFIMSLLDDFRNIPDNRKLTVKVEMMKIIKWAQASQEAHSDHDYVRDRNKFHRSTQTRSTQDYLHDYRSSSGFRQQQVVGRFMATDSESNSDMEELEVIEEDPISYESET